MQKAIKVLSSTPKNIKRTTHHLTVIQQLMKHLANPHQHFKSIHITGTNGKGSVALKTANILQKAGYRTGLFTSPHLFSYCQRIKVNNQPINQNTFSQIILKIEEISKNKQINPTFFQYITAAGFLYFKQQQCDFASIQVGIGGRYDTTNIITPQLSIITSIGLDHQYLLGQTREQIAYQKAGIIKQNIPVVIGPNANLKPIFEQASIKNSQVHQVKIKNIDFQQENIQISKLSMKILQQKGYSITDQHIQQAATIRPECRMQQLPQNLKPSYTSNKRIFFDVGHNPSAIQKMIDYYLKNIKKNKQKLIVLFGASSDKDASSSLKKLQQISDIIFFIEAKHERAQKVGVLSQYVGYSKYPHKFRMLDTGDISVSLQLALAQKNHQNIIICGSFFIMPQAWNFFKSK